MNDTVSRMESLLCVHDVNFTDYSATLCPADYLSCIPHLGFILISSFLLAVFGCLPSLKPRIKTPYTLHYPFHNARWITLFAVFVVLIFSILEGVLSVLKFQTPLFSQPYLYIPAFCACIATILAGVLYHYSEVWRRSSFMWLLLGYWLLALAAESLRLVRLTEEPTRLDARIVRFDVIVVAAAAYTVLSLLELCAILTMRVTDFNHKNLPADLQKPSMKYYMSYVSLPSRVLFSWQHWLLRVGYQHPLEISDLGSLPKMSTARTNENNFERFLQKEKERATRQGGLCNFSLYRVLFKAYWRWHVAAFLLKTLADILHFIVPLTVGGIVTYATVLYYDKEETKDGLTDFVTVTEFFSNGFVLLVIMGLVGLLRLVILHSNYHTLIVSSIHLTAGLQAAVYNKSLKLSGWTITSGSMTTGQITNLMSVDALHLMLFYQYGQYVYSIPLMVFVLMVLLVHLLGVAALISSVCFIIAIPIQYVLAGLQARIQKDAMNISDERLKQTHEMLQGMKLIKLYGWESIFRSVINDVRFQEVRKIMWAVMLYSVAILMSYFVPAFVTLLSFILFTSFTGSPLTPAIAFTTLTIVNQLRFPVRMFAQMIKHLINNHVSVQRLNAFFTATEIERCQEIIEDCHRQGKDFLPVNDAISDIDYQLGQAGSHGKATFHKVPSQDNMVELDHMASDEHVVNEGTGYMALKSEDINHSGHQQLPAGVAIKVNGSFSWDPESSVSTLMDIDVEIPSGCLTMIAGQVGTGKSSLVSAVLGEMHIESGYVHFNRKYQGIAYSAQRAWLLNASLKDNILFGREFDDEKFQAVVSACSLQPDIDILPAGINTEIGEKGINLSGGQKQRVSVARAIFSHSDIVLLDDPLSALDVHVGSHLFQEGILDQLLESKRTVVLVTHHLQYMKYAQKVLVMKDGRVSLQGSPSEVWSADPDLQITSCHLAEVASRSDAESLDEEAEKERKALVKLVEEKKKEEKESVPDAEGRLIEKEERNTGTISWRVVMFYLKAIGYPLVGLVTALTIMQHSLIVGTDFWLSNWSEAGDRLALENATQEERQTVHMYYVYSYTGMVLAAAVLSFIAVLALLLSGTVASKHLHTRMLDVISKAPMRFFDTTPVGRILNRFSGDINVVDSSLMNNVMFFLESSFKCLTAIIVNSIVSPFFIVVMIPVFICYIILQRYFIATSRELQRLNSITKSPIYAHFSETLSGLSTIRAYSLAYPMRDINARWGDTVDLSTVTVCKRSESSVDHIDQVVGWLVSHVCKKSKFVMKDEKRFKDHLLDCIDRNVIVFLYAQTCNRWLGVRLDAVGNLCVFLAGLTSLIVAVTSKLEPSYVGLALAYSINASAMLNWFIRQTSEIEIQMNAVERIKYYSQITTEDYTGVLPKSEWPERGAVSIDNISVRYANTLDPVLRNISVNIEPGEKIGICGRTGSGKSSFTLALFRIVDTFKGRILIDNRDISSLPLAHLRLKLSIIPQDPILFSGSVRFNLDPVGECDESELWTALDIAQLKTVVGELEHGLDTQVAEGGENFSMGQRQLFCLARAFLRKSRILILDEATASIDMETDDIVQRVLKEKFTECTILVIAHRVTTILDADRIIVLKEGVVVEYDTPENLLMRDDGHFASFVASTSH